MCLVQPALIFLAFFVSSSQGGNCWYSKGHTGKCSDLLEQKVDEATCCSTPHMMTAWSPQDLDPGSLFFWRALGGGVACTQCKGNCDDLRCGPRKRCVMRKNRPVCVCWTPCRTKDKRKGMVCGTDGRSYASLCRMRKKACRTRTSSLQVAYFGVCQRTCDKIKCSAGKYCVVDQSKNPHCIRCSRTCPYGPTNDDQIVCGTDGVTYSSTCSIKAASCYQGKAIPIAYKGRCTSGASCNSVQCSPSQLCLTDAVTGAPRCVTCNHRCPVSKRKYNAQYGGLICGSNNHTYASWCHMMKDACTSRLVIETKYPGSCRNEDKYSNFHLPSSNMNEVDSGHT